jgi:hypothetical protein
MSPSEDDLEVTYARADKRARRWLALLCAVATVPAWIILTSGPRSAAMVLAAFAAATVAIAVAWRAGIVARAAALFRLGSIRRAGLAATERLNQGDIEGAQRAYVALLKSARPLGAYHAGHVLMYGVTRFFQGHTDEALRLVNRVVDSGWFSSPRGQHFRAAAETWRVLMLLTAGQAGEARRRLEAFPEAKMTSARLLMLINDEQWQQAIDLANGALADSETPKAGRPTVAALGRHAARQLGREEQVALFDEVLEAEPLAEIAKLNPAFRGRLD